MGRQFTFESLVATVRVCACVRVANVCVSEIGLTVWQSTFYSHPSLAETQAGK